MGSASLHPPYGDVCRGRLGGFRSVPCTRRMRPLFRQVPFGRAYGVSWKCDDSLAGAGYNVGDVQFTMALWRDGEAHFGKGDRANEHCDSGCGGNGVARCRSARFSGRSFRVLCARNGAPGQRFRFFVIEPEVKNCFLETFRLRKVVEAVFGDLVQPVDIVVTDWERFRRARNTPNTLAFEAATEGRVYG